MAVESACHREVKYRRAGSQLAFPQSFAFLGEGTGPRHRTLSLALWREGLAGLPAAELPKAVSVMFLGPGTPQAHSGLDRVPPSALSLPGFVCSHVCDLEEVWWAAHPPAPYRQGSAGCGQERVAGRVNSTE